MMFYATLRRFLRYDSDTFRYDSLTRRTRSFGRNRNDFTIGVLVNRFGIDNSRAVEEYELEEGEIVDDEVEATPVVPPNMRYGQFNYNPRGDGSRSPRNERKRQYDYLTSDEEPARKKRSFNKADDSTSRNYQYVNIDK